MHVRRAHFVLLSFFFISVSSSSSAQWSLVKTFPAQVRSVYFLDQMGSGAIGFVGLANSTIWRTGDNGITWNQVNTPFAPSNLQVTGFAFRNALQGWCTLRMPNNASGAVWTTTDGGLNWISVYNSTALVSIAYCPTTNALVASCWGASAVQSFDLGVTWSTVALPFQDGATFSGANGVIGILSAPTPLYTSNGGRSWYPTSGLSVETWSPYGLPNSNIFFAAAEKTRQVFRSMDGGATWASTYTFPTGVVPTGCIHGNMSALFVQTNTNGFYYSTDLGNSWYNVCGPLNSLDTRFYAKGVEVFAGDFTGSLWYTPNGINAGSVSLTLDKPSLSYSGFRCSTYDSVIHFKSGFGCSSAILTKAQIINGSAFSLRYLSLPRLINGNDSIDVLYSPGPTLQDSGKLLLEFTLGATTIDTIIPLSGLARSSSSYNHDPSFLAYMPYACTTLDSAFEIRNMSCDTLTITSAYLSDSSHFGLLPFHVPYSIAPYDSVAVHIVTNSSHDGTFNSELKLHMIGGSSASIDDNIPLVLTVQRGSKPSFGGVNASLLNRCESMETSASIANPQCDSIVLLSASLSDSSVFHLDGLSLPSVIASGAVLEIPLKVQAFAKGAYSSLLRLRYLNGQDIDDTTIPLRAHVMDDVAPQVHVIDSVINMGTVDAPCASAERTLRIWNLQCRDLKLKAIYWDHPDSNFAFKAQSLPLTLAHDTGSVLIPLYFSPPSPNVVSNRLHLLLDIDGVSKDTSFIVEGTAIAHYQDTLLTTALNFGTLSMCSYRTMDAVLVNQSCNNVIARSAVLQYASEYSIIVPHFPLTIRPGDSIKVTVALDPQYQGVAGDSLRLTIYDPVDGQDYHRTVALRGSVMPASHNVAVEPAACMVTLIAACSNVDTSIVITNRGTCDNVIIQRANILGDGALVFDPEPEFPVVIRPDSMVRFTVRIQPHEEAVTTSTVVLSGSFIDTTIAFSYSSLPGAHAVTFSMADSTFTTKPCVPVIHPFAIANSGCDAVTLDGVSLLEGVNEDQFTLNGIPQLPKQLAPGDTLWAFVQYDPNGNGTGKASVQVSSKQAKYLRSIALTGSVVGTVPVAHVGLASLNGTHECKAKAGDTVTVAISVMDDIGDSSQLYQVSLVLNTNWNLLTPTVNTAMNGWTLVSTVPLANGATRLTLRRDRTSSMNIGDALLLCSFYPVITDTSACEISLSDLRFNEGQQNYESCILTASATTQPVTFKLIDTCGNPILREQLNGALALRIISINPNPIGLQNGKKETEITFETGIEGPVTIIARDLLGRQYNRMEGVYSAGTHSVRFSLPEAAEGTYFAEVQSGSVRQSRKLLIEAR